MTDGIALSPQELEARALPATGKDREFRCPECNNRCTESPGGDVEYGHARHWAENGPCSRRQGEHVNPNKFDPYSGGREADCRQEGHADD